MDWPNRDADLHELALAEWGRWDEKTLGPPEEYLEDLVTSYVSRKRWEYREQAMAHFSVQAEAMGMDKSKPRSPTPAANLTGIPGEAVNFGPPPLAALAMLGLGM